MGLVLDWDGRLYVSLGGGQGRDFGSRWLLLLGARALLRGFCDAGLGVIRSVLVGDEWSCGFLQMRN